MNSGLPLRRPAGPTRVPRGHLTPTGARHIRSSSSHRPYGQDLCLRTSVSRHASNPEQSQRPASRASGTASCQATGACGLARRNHRHDRERGSADSRTGPGRRRLRARRPGAEPGERPADHRPDLGHNGWLPDQLPGIGERLRVCRDNLVRPHLGHGRGAHCPTHRQALRRTGQRTARQRRDQPFGSRHGGVRRQLLQRRGHLWFGDRGNV